jgi:hypothetical protein
MISESFELKQFIAAVKDMDFLGIIEKANKEATEADRRWYRSRRMKAPNQQRCRQYATTLKEFIAFIRYGLRPNDLSEADFQLFRSACDGLSQKQRVEPRCQGA